MGLKKIFQEFMERHFHLTVVYVASSDRNGQPNCAPVIVIEIKKPDKVYYVDSKSSRTYANMLENERVSLAFMEHKSFSGFKLNGWSEILEAGQEYERLKNKLSKNINVYHTERIIERINGIFSRQPAEIIPPKDYVIIKFVAEEKREAVAKEPKQRIAKLAALQMRLDTLEKSDKTHQKGEQTMRRSRDFFKAQAKSFEKIGLEDELTGLYNRRGFTMLVEQQFKVAKRKGEEMFLIVSDMDHLKFINDKFGHAEGDRALADTARILRNTFRNSDVVARIGGDEFAVALGTGAGESVKHSMERLRKNFEKHNQSQSNPYLLELSCGLTSFQPNDPVSLDGLINRADKIMYEEKQKKYPKPE